jgi:protein phosphatase PTC7
MWENALYLTTKKSTKVVKMLLIFRKSILKSLIIYFSLLVVADGVGGWNDIGVDPALYSKELCKLIGQNFQKYLEKSDKSIDESTIKEIVVQSVFENQQLGSSTVCCLYLDRETNTLFSANIGDSGYLIMRKNEKGEYFQFFKSQEQTHEFNFPFQVGSSGDNPRCAETHKHQLKDGDLIILATDGLWDNLTDDEILKVTNKYSQSQKEFLPSNLAKYIAEKTSILCLKKDYESPFSKRAKQLNIPFEGGKPDDITVIVARVSQLSELQKDIEINEESQLNTTLDTTSEISNLS